MTDKTPLAQWLKISGISGSDLAKRVGVSSPFLSRIATGTRQPSLTIAAKLARETGLPLDKFLKADA